MEGENQPTNPAQFTSYHVRQARDGDPGSVEWVVERFSPLLIANARYRLRPPRTSVYEAEDVVQDVWAIVLRKLDRLVPQNERYTPVFVKYLSKTLMLTINNLVRKHVARMPSGGGAAGGEEKDPENIEAAWTGMVTRLVKRERAESVLESLERLEDRDRELVVLCGIEQHPYKEIAVILGEDAKSLDVRYQRALSACARQAAQFVAGFSVCRV